MYAQKALLFQPRILVGAQYVQDLATDKTAAKADGFFDAMEARARRELKYWRSMVRGNAGKPPPLMLRV